MRWGGTAMLLDALSRERREVDLTIVEFLPGTVLLSIGGSVHDPTGRPAAVQCLGDGR